MRQFYMERVSEIVRDRIVMEKDLTISNLRQKLDDQLRIVQSQLKQSQENMIVLQDEYQQELRHLNLQNEDLKQRLQNNI